MMESTQRQNLFKFALEAYSDMKHPRTYALTDESRTVLAILAQAILQRRTAEDRVNANNPTAKEEMAQLIQKLSDAGVNLLQKRPTDPPPTPKPWRDPVTDAPLPNPWVTKDLAGQTLLTQRDPALAEHYKAMAKDAYSYLAKLQDEQAERQSLGAIPYDAAHHKLNPFLGDNRTKQGEFIKSDPELAKFYEEEAKPVSIPLFGRNKNMTLEARLYKDPKAGATLKVAGQIAQQWLASDRQAALEQQKAAQAALDKLNAQVG